MCLLAISSVGSAVPWILAHLRNVFPKHWTWSVCLCHLLTCWIPLEVSWDWWLQVTFFKMGMFLHSVSLVGCQAVCGAAAIPDGCLGKELLGGWEFARRTCSAFTPGSAAIKSAGQGAVWQAQALSSSFVHSTDQAGWAPNLGWKQLQPKCAFYLQWKLGRVAWWCMGSSTFQHSCRL